MEIQEWRMYQLIINKDERKMPLPKKLIFHKHPLKSVYPSYSNYNVLRLREKYRQRQMDFIDGKLKGLKLVFVSKDATKNIDPSLYTLKHRIQDFGINILPTTKNKKGGSRNQVGKENRYKQEVEDLSGKGETPTIETSSSQ